MKNLIKILLINIAVVAVFFVIAEVGARAYFTLKTCLSGECDEFLFTRFNLFNENKMIGLSTTDPLLGYKPNPGFSGIIHHPPDGIRCMSPLTNTDFVVMLMTIM